MIPIPNLLRGLGGAFIGAALGFVLFQWIVGQGYYAGLLPGALIGIGCGLASGARSPLLAGICGVAGLLLGIFVEWKFFPFQADPSFSYFLQHLPSVIPLHLGMIALGAVLAAWFGYGRATPPQHRPDNGQP